MGEEPLTISTSVPFDRAVDQAIVTIKKGAYLLKCGRRGKPKLCPFRLSQDEKNLIWYSGQQEKHLRLSSVTKIIQGQGNIKSQKLNQNGKECHSFSLIYDNGEHSLDLICKDKAQATSWFLGLKAVISQSPHQKPFISLRSCKGIQSCVSSPAGILRRKKNLGLLEDTAEFTKVHSVCASPTLSLSERCFSDGLSYTCDSFYSSESFPSDAQRAVDNSVPNSPCIDPHILSKSKSTYVDTEYQKDLAYRYLVPASSPRVANSNILKDVMIWGGGIVGIAVSGDDQLVDQQGAHVLLPKLLESTMMLDVENIALGEKHASLVTKQGEVLSWGEGKGGRLGLKIDIDITSPKIVDSLNGVHVKDVACGEYHTCSLTNSGEVYAWGNDGCCVADQSGDRRFKNQWIPHKLSGPLDGIIISHVTCGEWHTAIVSSCGRLFTYGDGTFGALGHGNSESISQPKEVESLKGLWVRSVACGSWHTAAIVEVMVDRFKYNTGKLFTWGDGEKGMLGHVDNARKLLPTCVSQLLDYDFVQVSCGRMLTIALSNMGKVFTMGSAVHGQLGNPRAKDKSVTIVEGLLKQEFVKEISSGSYHVAVLTSSRSVYTWGKGANGQLGLGDTEDQYSPSFVSALRDWQVESIACGPSCTAAICLHKPISISDQSGCSGCKLPFGFTRKKHNCYNCGLLFCHPCSGKKVTNAALAPNKNKAFRVCDQCFNNKQLGSTPSVVASRSRNYNSQKLLKNQNKFTDFTEDRGEATVAQGPLLSLGQSCYKRSMPGGRKEWKNQQESQLNLENISSVNGGVPKWGQVSCPALFEDCTESSVSSFRNKKLGSLTSVNSESTLSNNLYGENDTTKSDKTLIEEVQRLRAEARILEEQCEIGNRKLQECRKKIEETWLLAKEEAAKSKAAKEVIKALVLRLQTVSDKTVAGQEGKLGIQECLSNLTPIRTDVKSPKYGNVDSLSNSPIVFSDSLKSKLARSSILKSDRSMEDSQLSKAESHEDSSASEGLKVEWVEQYEPGVYITLTSLPCGQKGLKRVRFSRKQFSEKEAERWWEKNQVTVYQKYGIEGYIKTSQNWEKG